MRLCCQLFIIVLSLSLFGASATNAETQEESEARLAELKASISKVNRWLTRANKEKTGLSSELERQERQIDKISKSIRHSNAKIAIFQKELDSLKKQLKENIAELKKHQHFLKNQLKSAYLHGEQPELKVLLNTENPQNLALDMHYFAAIKDAQNEELKNIEAALETVRSTKQSILTKQNKLNKQTIQLQQDKTALLNTAKKKKRTLAELNKSISSNKQKLSKLKADQTRLQELLQEIEQAIANIPIPDDAVPFSKKKGRLPWPAQGKVHGRFGSRLLEGKLKRNGIHIATKDEQEIKSVHAGRVVFSDWIRGFGLLIIIDHGNNYMTLYGNNKSLTKSTGDWVRASEIIAYSQESSTQTDSGLYFEIRQHGKPINPMRWLSK